MKITMTRGSITLEQEVPSYNPEKDIVDKIKSMDSILEGVFCLDGQETLEAWMECPKCKMELTVVVPPHEHLE